MEAVFGGGVVVHLVFGGQACGDCGDFEQCPFHSSGDCAGIIDVDAGVSAVVDAGDEQVDRFFAELHNGEFDAVGGRAGDAEAGETGAAGIYIDLVADEWVFEGDGMACAGAAFSGGDNGDGAEIDELFIHSRKARSENAVIVGEKDVHKLDTR